MIGKRVVQSGNETLIASATTRPEGPFLGLQDHTGRHVPYLNLDTISEPKECGLFNTCIATPKIATVA